MLSRFSVLNLHKYYMYRYVFVLYCYYSEFSDVTMKVKRQIVIEMDAILGYIA